MKHLVVFLWMLGFLNNIHAQESSDKIVGIWINEEKTNKIEIYNTNDSYAGKIVWISTMDNNPGAKPKDKNNPQPELRNRDLLGIDIITGLKYASGKWINGTLYTPKKGMYADCKVELLTNGQLKVNGSKSGFTKSQLWNRP
jgi:uncharacterized protein (DUF2147 family)